MCCWFFAVSILNLLSLCCFVVGVAAAVIAVVALGQCEKYVTQKIGFFQTFLKFYYSKASVSGKINGKWQNFSMAPLIL